MKKIGGKSFWIILTISIIGLLLLVIGIIFLTKENEQTFYQAGYIIDSNGMKSSKYYFNDNTVYKENVFEEYVFKDADNKEVSSGKENFIHYLDNSLSFMKNGVILDLDNFATNLVPYYNITDKSIIKYNNGSYYVETTEKDLIFTNFMGRITDNKYIIVGSNVSVKLAGNENPVKGDYFEITFIENGIVKVENVEGSYQTVGDGTTIFVGDKIKIDLGNKNILYNGEAKINLSEMTIDGNENINIVPSDKVKHEGDTSEEKPNNGGPDNNTPNGSTETPGETEPNTVIKQEVSVDLITADVGINNLSASFQVIDTASFIKGNLILTLTNTTTGERVYTKTLANVSDIQNINVSSLSPDCNYVMTIYEDNNTYTTQYFQKIFKTETLDLKLKREIITTESLSYSLDFGTSDIKSANISLYDENGNQIGNTQTINKETSDIVTFDSLKNNTSYTVIVDSVIFNNTNYADVYTIKTSDLTLKNKPTIGEISVTADNENQSFTLSMTKPTDEDKSITKYTYKVYKAPDDLSIDTIESAVPVYEFSQSELKNVILKVGENNIAGKQNYVYKVVVEYFDNYKYNEIETSLSDSFIIAGFPSVEFKEEKIDFNQIVGKVKLKDESCTISINGRVCNEEEMITTSNFIIRYYGGSITNKTSIEGVTFDSETLTYDLSLSGLTENTLYTFEVYADIDLHDGKGVQTGKYIGGFSATTKGIEALKMQNWKQNESTFELPINVETEMVSTIAESDYGEKLGELTFKLYKGDAKNNLATEPLKIVRDTENIKDKYYNKTFSLTSAFFGINSLTELRELSGGKLSRYYTIEITDAYDKEKINKFNILDNMFVFETPAILLLEDEVSPPEIIVEEITNIQTKSNEFTVKYDSKLGDNIIVGYKVTADFDKEKIEKYFQGENPITKINFYVQDKNERQIATQSLNLKDTDNYQAYFFLDYGTEYSTIDSKMARGNTYKFSYDLSIDSNNDGTEDELFPSNKPLSDNYTSVKQDPIINKYIENSTKNQITYKYKILDYDNALYKEEDTYYISYRVDSSEEEHQVAIVKSSEYNTFTIDHLQNQSIYELSYYRANTKNQASISKVKIGSYYFDGYYDANDYNLGFKLEYGNFDNRLKIIIPNNEFLNRVSAYLLTLTSGSQKYTKVITNLNSCDENKCIIVDYANIKDFKGKDIKVSLEAFYDTGYIGFNNKSNLGSYFQKLGLVDENNKDKVGYAFQNTNTTIPGSYVYIETSAYLNSQTPKGILGFELNNSTSTWKLTTINLLDIKKETFVEYGEIIKPNANVKLTPNGVYEISASTSKNTFNPKVLDVATIQTENDNFKFTSITPKVSSEITPLINGGIVDINLSIDEDTLSTDFVKKDNKYAFYIDIYEKEACMDSNCPTEFVKTIETDYNNLTNITFDGLSPNKTYYYKISADMNKNGQAVKTPLFDFNRSGYVEYQKEFSTLTKADILLTTNAHPGIDVKYESVIDKENNNYSKRDLTVTASLKTNINFDVKFQIYDLNGELKYEKTIKNANITEGTNKYLAKYIENISGNDFVFGNDYYTLKVSAVTTDLGLELELYNELLRNNGNGIDIGELENPIFTVTPSAYIKDNNGTYSYGLSYTIVVQDEDKTIKDGIYNIELQDAAYKNACPGNEANCQMTVDIKNGTCEAGPGRECTVKSQDNKSFTISASFDNLKPDTNYVIYVYANTYRNNISLTSKEGLVYVRKGQYTKNNLNFSLGAVTPTVVSKNKLVITFAGASNLENTLLHLEYSINVQGGENVASGSLVIGEDINFKKDKDNYPTLEISIPEGKELGLNNYILITYSIEKEGNNYIPLEIDGRTIHQYNVKNASN